MITTSASKQTIRREAEKHGHTLGRFQSRKLELGQKIYDVTWCTKCDRAFFANEVYATERQPVSECKP